MTTILVVDDSELDRRFVASLLKDAPYEVNFAENGAKALDMIERQAPDLILTDLQMPEMDGLELVANVRLQAPHVPIVLMTAHGSESIAAEALQRGAASYVPKAELVDRLVPTIDEIMALHRADRSYARLVDCSTKTEFDFHLPNDMTMIDPLVDLMQQMLRSMELCDANGEVQIGVALEQAIQNAILHGNLELNADDLQAAECSRSLIAKRQGEEPYSSRQVQVLLRMSRTEAEFIVRDQGRGFDVTFEQGQSIEITSGASRGRGLVLMSTFMDEVQFSDHGRHLRMLKRRSA